MYLNRSQTCFIFKIFEWAENRVRKKQEELNEEDFYDGKPTEDDSTAKKEKSTQTFIFNLNDSIKAELIDILPFIRFKKMNISFLHTFVVKRGFLFSYDELSDILDNAEPAPKVKITNSYGESIIGLLPYNCDIVENIKSLKNHPHDYSDLPYKALWTGAQIKRWSVPSPIDERDGIEWYLYYHNGGIGIINRSCTNISELYLVAEMTLETSEFEITKNCKIEIE
uniref:Uncharacterized protein n=1 Tax=Panagrolaimus davidi TaxID=227884 RepID=A0A914PB97_9BILA